MFSYFSAINGAINGVFGVCCARSVRLRWALKFWLACFLLLFVGAELLEWISHFGRVDASGTWLILGGMGLAAASNMAHLSERHPTNEKGSDRMSVIEENSSTAVKPAAEESVARSASVEAQSAGAQSTEAQSTEAQSIEAQSKEDSISFKVRLPWR